MATAAKWKRTPEQRANLLKLAAWLKQLKDPKVFEMRNYVATAKDPLICDYDKSVEAMVGLMGKPEPSSAEQVLHECGTVCCAIGMTPFAFPEEAKKFVSELPFKASWYSSSWHGFADRLFGVIHEDYWAWMFESFWADVDNTPEGAAFRIEFFVSAKRPPSFYRRERLRDKSPDFIDDYQKWRSIRAQPKTPKE